MVWKRRQECLLLLLSHVWLSSLFGGSPSGPIVDFNAQHLYQVMTETKGIALVNEGSFASSWLLQTRAVVEALPA